MTRSFRAQLALRAAGTMALALTAISAVGVLALRAALDAEVDASILNVARVQASSITDEPSGEMHFHDWELTPDEAASVRDLVRYAQVWQSDGVSLLRSQYMTSDLPLDRALLARAGEGELIWTRRDWEGRPIRALYYPLERFGMAHERHVLEVAAPLDARNALLARVIGFLAVLSVGLTVATFLGAWWLADRAVRPVAEVVDQAEEIGVGSLDRRIHAYADTNEYRRLVDVLNTMLSRIQSAFETQRRFTADASHELRSPLTAMRGELEVALRRERPPEEYVRVIGSTLEEVERLSRMTEGLLMLARSDAGALDPARAPTDVAAAAERVVARMTPLADEGGSALAFAREGPAVALADEAMVTQVVWNLLDNALCFTPSGGRVEVSVGDDGNDVVIVVEDTGPGFGPGDPSRFFTRFFRADDARTHRGDATGSGLGLAIVRAVVDAHGGSVAAQDRPGGGARVVVRFPAEHEGSFM